MNPQDAREPLALVPWTLWVHAALGALGGVVLWPLGVGLARVGSAWHRRVQTAGLVCIVTAVAFALTTGSPTHGARHLTGAAAGARHDHATLHATLGLAITAVALAQASLGSVLHWNAGYRADSAYREASALMHRGVGYGLVVVAGAVQPVLGLAALFQICEFSGTDQCVGHFGPACALGAASAAYYVLGQNDGIAEDRSNYGPIIVEHACVGLLGLFSTLYSLYSGFRELPVSALLIVGPALVLWHVRELHRKTKPVPRWLHYGVPMGLMAIAVGVVLAVHAQPTEYGSVMHGVFGTLLALAGVSRMARFFTVLSSLLVMAASVFVAAQSGFQVLYGKFYHEHTNIGVVVVVAMLAGAVPFLCMAWWTGNFANRYAEPKDTLHQRVRELVREA